MPDLDIGGFGILHRGILHDLEGFRPRLRRDSLDNKLRNLPVFHGKIEARFHTAFSGASRRDLTRFSEQGTMNVFPRILDPPELASHRQSTSPIKSRA